MEIHATTEGQNAKFLLVKVQCDFSHAHMKGVESGRAGQWWRVGIFRHLFIQVGDVTESKFY